MPRQRRTDQPGQLLHARTRFVNEEFRIRDDTDRAVVKRLLGRALRGTDTLVLAFAIMSTHIHLLLLRRRRALEALYRSFHTSLAKHLNARYGRYGPVVADRPLVEVVEEEAALGCLHYVHSNQKEARASSCLPTSDWTSHPLYRDVSARPWWLAVFAAAQVTGFTPDEAGVQELVSLLERCDPKQPYSPADVEELRRETRALVVPVDRGTPIVGPRGLLAPEFVTASSPYLHPDLPLGEGDIAAAVADSLGVAVSQLRSRQRHRLITGGRALCLLVWRVLLGRPSAQMASYLGISDAAASQLVAPESPALARALERLPELVATLGLGSSGAPRK